MDHKGQTVARGGERAVDKLHLEISSVSAVCITPLMFMGAVWSSSHTRLA